MQQQIYFLGRIERSILEVRRKHTNLKGMHEESLKVQDVPHPFLWEGYEDIERHYAVTIQDVLADVNHEFTIQSFFHDELVETFYKTFKFKPIFTTKEGMESFIEANRKSGADVSDYEIELAHTNFDTHTLILYAF